MGIADRIEGTIENWRAKWQATLKEWMASWMEWGFEKLFDAFEPDVRTEITPQLNQLKTIPNLPAEWRTVLDKATTSPSFIQFAALVPYLIGALFGLAMGSIVPIANWGRYFIDKFVRSARLDPLTAIRARWRGIITEDYFKSILADQGWSDDDIKNLHDATLFIPTADEQTLWLAREVYEPRMVEKYKLDDELPVYEDTDFSKVGVSPEQMRNKWRAHWMHATWIQIIEMLHRKLITEDDVWEWFRLVEIVPFWRQLLIDSAYTWPTRVDVRRWWDMRTIDEARLRELYEGMGYRGKNLDDYVLWTKVYVDFPMMMTRFSKGWITEEDIREWLRRLEIPEDRITQFIQEKTQPEKPERVAKERDMTATEIMKGVKKGILTEAEGIELLMDLGYDEDEARLKLEIYGAVEAGSPDTFAEFKGLTTRYKIAIGKEERPMPEELKKAAEEVVRLTKEVESLQESIKAEEVTFVEEEILPPEATARRDELRVALHQAEAELFHAKSEYDRQVAEWRHGL